MPRTLGSCLLVLVLTAFPFASGETLTRVADDSLERDVLVSAHYWGLHPNAHTVWVQQENSGARVWRLGIEYGYDPVAPPNSYMDVKITGGTGNPLVTYTYYAKHSLPSGGLDQTVLSCTSNVDGSVTCPLPPRTVIAGVGLGPDANVHIRMDFYHYQ